MVLVVVGLGLALTAFALQWYMEKQVRDAEARAREYHRIHDQDHAKTRVTIMLDNDVLDAFRRQAKAEGHSYKMAINEALREAIKQR